MTRKQNRSSRSIRLKRGVPIEVRPVPFKTFESLRYLDVSHLKRAAHARFEVGRFEGGCCRRTVHAVVRKGRVTKLEIEPCKRTVRINPEVRAVIEKARKSFASARAGSRRLPVAVNTFLSSAEGFTIDVSGCFWICAFGWCLICCFDTTSPYGGSCDIDTDPFP